MDAKVLSSKGATKISLPSLMQNLRFANTYLRNGSNLLKDAGKDPIINATASRTTTRTAASTKRSFQLYLFQGDHIWRSAFSWI